jgi:autotransporter-associated beta strand protein/uncharacterized repeat protein (TIGR03803 family)
MKYLACILALGAALCASTADSQTLTTLVTFTGTGGTASGSEPQGSLTLSGTTIYGITDGGGANFDGNIFSVGTDGTNYRNLVSFTGYGGTASGANPEGSLTLGGSALYGMTQQGGANECGNIFRVGTGGTNYQDLLSFTGSGGAASGQYPQGSLTLVGTTLYGMTLFGGASGDGNIFSLGTGGTNYENLVSFTGAGGTASGAHPYGNLTLSGTALYGITVGGGANADGNIFSVGTGGTSYRNLASFTGSGGTASGANPFGSLTLSGTRLYGMTGYGGAGGYGNIFSVGTGGTHYQDLLSFTGTGGAASGEYPGGSLTLSGTTFYGTTSRGGADGYGNIFSVGIDGSDYQSLYSFTGSADGGNPGGSLTISGGTLFGITSQGGASGDGTVFALQIALSVWHAAGGGSWKNGSSWSSQTGPNGAGLQAVLGGSPTASCTITLDGSQTVGSLTFNNGTAGYTLSAGSGGTLILNNSGGTGSQIVVLAGSHSITAPVEIADGNLSVAESGHDRLIISGNISDDNGAESLALYGDGSGVLVLSGTNTYGGRTIVEDGKLVSTSPAALPVGGSLIVGAEAVSIFAPLAAAAQSPTAVPEPSTLALLGFAAIAFLARKWLGENHK